MSGICLGFCIFVFIEIFDFSMEWWCSPFTNTTCFLQPFDKNTFWVIVIIFSSANDSEAAYDRITSKPKTISQMVQEVLCYPESKGSLASPMTYASKPQQLCLFRRNRDCEPFTEYFDMIRQQPAALKPFLEISLRSPPYEPGLDHNFLYSFRLQHLLLRLADTWASPLEHSNWVNTR